MCFARWGVTRRTSKIDGLGYAGIYSEEGKEGLTCPIPIWTSKVSVSLIEGWRWSYYGASKLCVAGSKGMPDDRLVDYEKLLSRQGLVEGQSALLL